MSFQPSSGSAVLRLPIWFSAHLSGRLTPPWMIQEHAESFIVRDATRLGVVKIAQTAFPSGYSMYMGGGLS